ncbi:hypothetical protein ElyMa_006476900 [Elysia marginata]|uniref:Uncharacterized protein n=1 Tax=Elysia marginata TaxID=1093978 RepID=A0AAV4I0L2_9GAST|nr:hypothetical protein ElyMa_006476900 [Elysia marginata]
MSRRWARSRRLSQGDAIGVKRLTGSRLGERFPMDTTPGQTVDCPRSELGQPAGLVIRRTGPAGELPTVTWWSDWNHRLS